MDSSMAAGSTPSDKFFRYFQQELADATTNIEAIQKGSSSENERSQSVDQCQANITRLSDEVRDATSYIPAHDRRVYSEAIKGLQQKLKGVQADSAPRQKFSFKSTSSGPAARRTKTVASPPAAQPADSNGMANGPGQSGDARQESSGSHDESIAIANQNIDYITFPTSEEDVITGSYNLSRLHRCVVELSTAITKRRSLTSLTAKDVEESLIVCGHVDGPAHLTNMTNSTLVISSRQFRMHDSRNCDIYLLTTSRPIIENCTAIRFAPLPDVYRTGVDERVADQWQQVDDFNWHRIVPSPNWSILDVSQRAKAEAWLDVVTWHPGDGVDDILKAVLPPK